MVDKDGGPAFPFDNPIRGSTGMSLRDWFAGMALQSGGLVLEAADSYPEAVAKAAYEIADAMLAERT